MNAVHSRTLQRALESVGTKDRLATALGVPVAHVEAYLEGKAAVPNPVFIAALDIVAQGRSITSKPQR